MRILRGQQVTNEKRLIGRMRCRHGSNADQWVDQTLTNGKELVFQPTVLRSAATATGFLQHYLEFQFFKMDVGYLRIIFLNVISKCVPKGKPKDQRHEFKAMMAFFHLMIEWMSCLIIPWIISE
jgi:hypothetical protein